MIMPINPRVGSKPVDPLNPSPIYSSEAEAALLGCMLAEPQMVMDDVLDSLGTGDFYALIHQDIFDALAGMWKNKVAIDVLTVHQWLTDRKMAESVGSPGILAELFAGFATHLNIGSYIRIVKDKSLLRATQTACVKVVQMIADAPESVGAVLDFAETAILGVSSGLEASDAQPMSQLVVEASDAILGVHGATEPGISSGFERLDRVTLGWHRGQMIVLAARPGVGKSALAGKFGLHAASIGVPTGIVSIEMSTSEWMNRAFAAEARLSLQRIRQGITLPRDQEKIIETRDRMAPWPLYIDSPSSLTINGLRAKARRMVKKFGIELLIVDYLQLMTAPGQSKSDNRQNEVATISRGVKSLAKELNIPIIILAQLNRQAATNSGEDREPELHHLKESGSIEQDADVVMLLHRKKVENEDAPPPVLSYSLNVAKQRNGPRERLELLLHSAYTLFEQPVMNS